MVGYGGSHWRGDILTADCDGFDSGDAGSFEILDGRNVTELITTVAGKVKESGGTKHLEAKWKPAFHVRQPQNRA